MCMCVCVFVSACTRVIKMFDNIKKNGFPVLKDNPCDLF